jgi:hypothetical protein
LRLLIEPGVEPDSGNDPTASQPLRWDDALTNEFISHASADSQTRRDFRNRVRLDSRKIVERDRLVTAKTSHIEGDDIGSHVNFLSELLALALCGITGGLPSLTCSGCRGECKRGISSGQVAHSGELPARDDQSGVLVRQFTGLFGGLALPISAAFTPNGPEGRGVSTTF